MDAVEWAKNNCPEAYCAYRWGDMSQSELEELRSGASDRKQEGEVEGPDSVTTKPPYDAVENPPHYAQYTIQPIEFIMANRLGYCEGNVVKYISRWRMKDGVQDLEKARNYINILIEEEKKK